MNKTVSFRLNYKMGLATGMGLVGLIVAGMAIQAFLAPIPFSQAEQMAGSPDSGVSSRLVQAYESVVDQGHGASAVPQWTEDWGAAWNRIMAAASWMPGGNVETDEVMLGKTYFAGNRILKTGTLDIGSFNQIGLYQDLSLASHWDQGYGFGSWTERVASGGSPASVSLNGSSLTLPSSRAVQDDRTQLMWTDATAASTHNLFVWANGDSRINPTGQSCNFNAAGNANQWCNVSDYTGHASSGWSGWANPNGLGSADGVKTGVSANEFCLNLVADDGDGSKSDWRLPTQREVMVAYLNGAQLGLPNSHLAFLLSTQGSDSPHETWRGYLDEGWFSYSNKWESSRFVRCVRG